MTLTLYEGLMGTSMHNQPEKFENSICDVF
jgi:hypothetical protein